MKSDSCKLAPFYTFTRDVISPDPSRSITVSNVISHSIFNQIRRYCKNQRCNIVPRNPRLHLTSSEDDQKRRENSRQLSELSRHDLVAVGSIDASGRLAFIKHISPAAWLISIFFKSKRWSHFASEKKRSLLSRQWFSVSIGYGMSSFDEGELRCFPLWVSGPPTLVIYHTCGPRKMARRIK